MLTQQFMKCNFKYLFNLPHSSFSTKFTFSKIFQLFNDMFKIDLGGVTDRKLLDFSLNSFGWLS